ncbi:MAG: ATP-binding protein [bacterium]
MQETLKNISIDSIISLYRASDEFLLMLDANNNIIFLNNNAKNLFGDIKKIEEIEHFFSFNVCILDREKFFDYNPIREVINSNILFSAETLFQIDSNLYKNLNMRSFSIQNSKIIILSDFTEKIQNISLKNRIKENEKTIEKLEKENKEFSELKEKAQTLAIRTGLINKISNKIRDGFDIDEIIQTAVEEISKTLDLSQGFYAAVLNGQKELIVKHSWVSENEKFTEIHKINPDKDDLLKKSIKNKASNTSAVIVDNDTGESRSKLITPIIYNNEILGILSFLHAVSKKHWHKEEITMIEGISAQLASAINQAKLFNELEEQKLDLEKALLELKQTQSQLIQSEKMASLGQLVAGVAHEINTPMGSIKSNNDIFIKCIQKIKTVSSESEMTKYSEILDDTLKVNAEAIKRINSIVKALKNFARLDEAEYKETDIHEGIKSTLMLINHEIKGKIRIIEEFGNLPLINCYPNQLNQVFMNILVNACQSIEKTGSIKIKTENYDDKIKIIISDTGKGIPEGHLERIFDPGFTTKGVGIGTGLGLSICYRIIEQHKGSIKVESLEGRGSVFTIEMPKN